MQGQCSSPHYQQYYENRVRSDSSFSQSYSTDQLYSYENVNNTGSCKNSKQVISNIILTNLQPSIPLVATKKVLCYNQPIEDQEMNNLTFFFNILSQIQSQQSEDQIRKEESAINERKREIRKLKIQKYREKKQSRKWDVLRYEVRKNIAKSRLRIKGRFVKE